MAQQFTQKAIRDTFVKMLNEHPFDKITVKDLVDECGVNRNTFYYYYNDIYDVLSEVFQSELEEALAEHGEAGSWEDGLLNAFRFALNNKKAIYHVYNSVQQRALEKYLFEMAGKAVRQYMDNACGQISVSLEDREIVTLFHQSALTGIVLKWVSDGMQEDPEKHIRRVGRLMEGSFCMMLEKCAQPNK